MRRESAGRLELISPLACLVFMILLVNPRATTWHYRIPLSVLSIGASIEGKFPYEILDGNIDPSLHASVLQRIGRGDIRYLGITVMPGPQLREAILLSRRVRQSYPKITIIWGGYFPSLHAAVTLQSGYVDYVVRDQGDLSFQRLITALEQGGALDDIPGISSIGDGTPRDNRAQGIVDPNSLSPLPYHRVDVRRYVGRTYLGTRTVNYHSSVGCPFVCGFCAVAAEYKARWIGLPAQRVADDLRWFKTNFNVNAIEFHDNNFFTSERRTAEFSERMKGMGIRWWGEARPDTMLNYDDRTWASMRDAGLAMVFFGAESSSTEVLRLMEKGGTQTGDTVLALVEKMRRYDIIPELSFVLGAPTPTIDADVENDIRFIRKVKRLNPDAEIVLYVYSPVHFEDSDLYKAAVQYSFSYPKTLEDWLRPPWSQHDLRKDPSAPWISKSLRTRIRNFEKVLNSAFPTISDLKLTPGQRTVLKSLGRWRYRLGLYRGPMEIMTAQRLFRYRQPEVEGF